MVVCSMASFGLSDPGMLADCPFVLRRQKRTHALARGDEGDENNHAGASCHLVIVCKWMAAADIGYGVISRDTWPFKPCALH
jgi:hypothetical protein